jgi:hypothetical protein
MGELKRKEDELTTADLTGRTDVADRTDVGEDPTRPKLVKSETAEGWDRQNAETKNVQRAATDTATPLFSDSDIGDLRSRWANVQTGFVDEPRHAVEEADNLVATVMKRLAESFATERSNLEKQWDRGDNVSTEDLRVALQRYRTFFDRLLNV